MKKYSFLLLLFLIPFGSGDIILNTNNYYTIDNSFIQANTIIDSVFNQNCTNINGNLGLNAKINEGVYLSGNAYLNCGIPLEIGTQNFSYGMWFYPNSTGFVHFLVDNIGITGTHSNNNRFFVTQEVNGSLRLFTRDTVSYNIYTPNLVNVNQWNYLFVARNGASYDLYLNNVKTSGVGAIGSISQGRNWSIGAQVLDNYFVGLVDEIAVFNNYQNQTNASFLYNNNIGIQYPFFENSLPVNFNIYNATNNQLINQLITVQQTNNLGAQTKTTSTGMVGFVINNTLNNNFRFTSSNFQQNEYFIFAGQNQTSYNIYLFDNAELVSFNVQDLAFNNLENALIEIQTLIGGQFVTYSVKSTDVTGSAAFNLVLDQIYKIIVSKEGFVSQEFNIEITQNSYILRLRPLSGFQLDGPITDVFYSYLLKNFTLPPEQVTFQWLVQPLKNDLVFSQIEIYNGTTLLASNISNANVGGILDLTYNFSAFNNSFITVVYSFQKDGFPLFQLPVIYYIQETDTAFTVVSARQYAQDNISIGYRLAIWLMFAFVVMFVMAYYGIVGRTNPLFAMALSLFPAYFLAITFAPIIAIFAIFIIGWVFSGREGVQG